MLAGRLQIAILVFALGLTATAPSRATEPEKLSLARQERIGEVAKVQMVFKVGGDVRLASAGKSRDLPMGVEANLSYDEQLLSLGGTPKAPWRSVRYYHQADASIAVDKGNVKPALSGERRLVAVEALGGVNTLFSPAGPLSREELDLIDLPGSTLLIDQLLPREPVAIGDTWKHPDQLIFGLLGLDAVSFSDVQSVLAEVTDGKAKMTLAGAVHGAVGGVGTEIELKAKYDFDLKLKRITWFALLIKEKRAVGHVSPGLDVVAKLIVTITPIASSAHLEPATLAKLSTTPNPTVTRLVYAPTNGKWRFLYDRNWFVTSDEKDVTVMRLVERGDLIAQCNVSQLSAVAPGKLMTLAEFQSDIQKTLGTNFGQFVNASQSTDEAGSSVYRVAASGTVSQLSVQWIYFLVANKQGQRISLAFTLESDLVERFGQADKALVSTLRFVAPAAEAAQKPTVAR